MNPYDAAQVAEMRAVLELVEWAGRHHADGTPVCPACGADPPPEGGHETDCRLARAIHR